MKLQRVGLPREQVDALSELTHSTVEVAVQPMVQRLDGLESSIEVRFAEAEKSIRLRFKEAEKSINLRFEAAEKSISLRFEAAEKSINLRFEAAEKANAARFAEVHMRLDTVVELIAENGRQISQLRDEVRSQTGGLRGEFGGQLSQLRDAHGSQLSQLRSEIRADRKLLAIVSLALLSAAIAMVGMTARLFLQ